MTRLQLAALLIVVAACGPTAAPEEASGVLVPPSEPVRIVSWSGCAAEAELELVNRGPGPVQLEAPRWVSGNLDFVEAEGAGPRALSPGEIAQVTLRAAELPEAVAFDQYVGRLAMGGGEQWLEVEVEYSAVIGVIDVPSQMHFGAVTLGDSLALPLGRRNVTDVATWYEVGPLTGDHATFPGFEAPIRVELGPKQESQLPVTFAPTTLGPHLAFLRYTMPLDCRDFAINMSLTGTGVE